MGLDMYMFKKHKSTEEIIHEDMPYWRKANQIRNWLVRNTGYPINANCYPFPITETDLKKLIADCECVVKDHSLAYSVLPTSDGYFFGSTEYDDEYFDTLKETVEMLTELIKTTDFEKYDIEYYEWW